MPGNEESTLSPTRRLRLVAGDDAGSDEQLLVRTARGDRDAFEGLYDRFSPRVYGLVRQVVVDRSLSQETTQEVMTELWRTADRFDPNRGNATTWILTLTHRRAVDTVRREQSARDRNDRAGRRNQTRSFDHVVEGVTMTEEHAEVRAALDQLTDLQREAIELAYFNGYTYREVSKALDVPLGTVKTRMRDGMMRLRDALGVAT